MPLPSSPVVAAYSAYLISQRRIREKLYSERPAISPEDYYEKYFSTSGINKDIVTQTIEIPNGETRLDFTRIDPDQQIDGSFGDWTWADDWDGISYDLEDLMKVPMKDFPQISTTRELIEQVAERAGSTH